MIEDTEKLLARTPLPYASRLSSQKFMLIALAAFGILLIYLFMTLSARQRVRETPQPPPKPGVYEVSGTTEPDVALRLQTSYAGWNREPPVPKPTPIPPAAELPQPQPMFTPLVQAAPVLPSLPPPASNPALPATLPPAAPPNLPSQKQIERIQTPTPKQITQPKSWMKGEMHLAKPPFEVKQEKLATSEQEEKKTSSLIQQANWATPQDPTHVLYRSQTIHGILLHEVNSDLPGQIQILVVRPVQDKFGQGITLIPQHTIMLGEQQGKTVYGMTRLDVSIVELEYPNGTLVSLAKSKLTDKSGAVGGAGDVNNHYAKLGIAAVLSAVLNVGARSVAGNQTGFAPTIEQQTASDIGSSINRSGQSIVQRELQVSPTITIKAGTEVAVQLQENISFTQPPTPVK